MTNLTHNSFILLYVYYRPLHVSNNVVFIIRRSNCINTASGIVTLCKWPSGAQVEREFSLNLCTGRLFTEVSNIVLSTTTVLHFLCTQKLLNIIKYFND